MQIIVNFLTFLLEFIARLGFTGNSFIWYHEPKLPEEWSESDR